MGDGLLLLAANGAAFAPPDGIPALLKFAEQRQAPPAALGKTPRVNRCSAPAAKSAAIAGADGVRLTSLKQSLQQQAEKIRQLERQLAAAQAAAAPKRERVDIRPLADALKGLRKPLRQCLEVRIGRFANGPNSAAQGWRRSAAQQRIHAGRAAAGHRTVFAGQRGGQTGVCRRRVSGARHCAFAEENRHAGLEADSRRCWSASPPPGGCGWMRPPSTARCATAQQRLQQTQAPPPPLDDKAYLADFARQEGVKQDALGFYRVDYAGNGRLAPTIGGYRGARKPGRRPGGQRVAE